jgi:hypothetical protein
MQALCCGALPGYFPALPAMLSIFSASALMDRRRIGRVSNVVRDFLAVQQTLRA